MLCFVLTQRVLHFSLTLYFLRGPVLIEAHLIKYSLPGSHCSGLLVPSRESVHKTDKTELRGQEPDGAACPPPRPPPPLLWVTRDPFPVEPLGRVTDFIVSLG